MCVAENKALIVLVHTDEGLTGGREVDSSPEVVRTLLRSSGAC